MVAERQASVSLPTIFVLASGDSFIHGCVSKQMGSSSPRPHSLRRSRNEKGLHVNLLEMCAILLALGLYAFQDRLISHTVGLMNDNTSVIAYINKQEGTISSFLYFLARQVMTWAETSDVTLMALTVS